MAFAVGFAYWKSLRSPRWGIWAGVLFGIALGVKHNAWLMPFFLVCHYLWMRRGDLRARRLPRPPLAFVAMLVLGPHHLLRALAVAVERADRAHARIRQPPPAARALQLRVPRPQLEQPAHDHRAEVDPCDGAVRRDRVHRPRDDAGAGGGRRRRRWCGGAADSRWPTAVPRKGPPPATRSRAGSARGQTSIGRRARSCWRRRWGRWRFSLFRPRRSSAASSTS